MSRCIDIVNFNADASCMDTGRWLSALRGGVGSEFYRWLNLYVEANRPMVLGMTGATVADVSIHNPESIQFVRENKQVFQILLRPFSHDIALIRDPCGFRINLDLGMRAIEHAFESVSRYYLPPEFMLSNEQISILFERSVAGTFVNSSRLASDLQGRVPDRPYVVRGTGGADLFCLPVSGCLTDAYLNSLHCYSADPWNDALAQEVGDPILSWRDGESAFLLPDGIERERAWLVGESVCHREFLPDDISEFGTTALLRSEHLRSYPVHSFLAWMREFRMMGYFSRLARLETTQGEFSAEEMILWLQVINSDVLSAVEKQSPRIMLVPERSGRCMVEHTLYRSERGFEGEECLSLLERCRQGDPQSFRRFLAAGGPLAEKVQGRLQYLRMLGTWQE